MKVPTEIATSQFPPMVYVRGAPREAGRKNGDFTLIVQKLSLGNAIIGLGNVVIDK